jgi:hypothetical protein
MTAANSLIVVGAAPHKPRRLVIPKNNKARDAVVCVPGFHDRERELEIPLTFMQGVRA